MFVMNYSIVAKQTATGEVFTPAILIDDVDGIPVAYPCGLDRPSDDEADAWAKSVYESLTELVHAHLKHYAV